jgi:hypothetical protein
MHATRDFYFAPVGQGKVLWDHRNGIVFAGIGIAMGPGSDRVPHIVASAITGPNPLF